MPILLLLALGLVVVGLWQVPWGGIFSLKSGLSNVERVRIEVPDIVSSGQEFRADLIGLDSAGRQNKKYRRSATTRLRIEGGDGTIRATFQGSGFQVLLKRVTQPDSLRLLVSDGTAFGTVPLQWRITPAALSLASTSLYSGRCTALSLNAVDQYSNRAPYTPSPAARVTGAGIEFAWRVGDGGFELCLAAVEVDRSVALSVHDGGLRGDSTLRVLAAVDLDFIGAAGFDSFDALLLSRAIGVSPGTLHRNPDIALRGFPTSRPSRVVVDQVLRAIRSHATLLDLSGDGALDALDGQLLKRHVRNRAKLQSGTDGLQDYQRAMMSGLQGKQIDFEQLQERVRRLFNAIADPEALRTAIRATP